MANFPSGVKFLGLSFLFVIHPSVGRGATADGQIAAVPHSGVATFIKRRPYLGTPGFVAVYNYSSKNILGCQVRIAGDEVSVPVQDFFPPIPSGNPCSVKTIVSQSDGLQTLGITPALVNADSHCS